MSDGINRHFEELEHVGYGGETQRVPLLVARKEGLTEESNGLLHAVNIISGNPEQYENDVMSLLERLANRLEHDPEGVIFEDVHGAGSINIRTDKSRINIHGVGVWDVPTPLLFEMIYAWGQMPEHDSSA
jgi:hypothetical protein